MTVTFHSTSHRSEDRKFRHGGPEQPTLKIGLLKRALLGLPLAMSDSSTSVQIVDLVRVSDGIRREATRAFFEASHFHFVDATSLGSFLPMVPRQWLSLIASAEVQHSDRASALMIRRLAISSLRLKSLTITFNDRSPSWYHGRIVDLYGSEILKDIRGIVHLNLVRNFQGFRGWDEITEELQVMKRPRKTTVTTATSR